MAAALVHLHAVEVEMTLRVQQTLYGYRPYSLAIPVMRASIAVFGTTDMPYRSSNATTAANDERRAVGK